MEYLINKQKVEAKDFFMTFYATSLNVESQENIGLLYARGVAETLLTKEQLDAMAIKLSSYYGATTFQKQNAVVVGGVLFEIIQTENPVEVAA